jgi:hypothetical protein
MPFRIDISEIKFEAQIFGSSKEYDGFIWVPTLFGIDRKIFEEWIETRCIFYSSSDILYAVVKALGNGYDWGCMEFGFPRIKRLFVEATSLEVIGMIRKLHNPVHFVKRGVFSWEE